MSVFVDRTSSNQSVNSVESVGILVVFSYAGEFCVIHLGLNDTFQTILSRLSCRWNSLDVNKVSLSYAVPEFAKCLLTNDEDLRNMVRISRSSRMERVRVDVVEVDANSSMKSSFMDFDDGDGFDVVDDEQDIIPTFSSHESKVLLTAGWNKCVVGVGQTYKGGAVEFRIALQKMSIESGYPFSYVKNDRTRVTVCCSKKLELGCSWMVHALEDPVNKHFYIRKMEHLHTCGTSSRNLSGVRGSSNLVADIVRDDVRINPSTRPFLVKKDLLSNYGITVSYGNAWKGVDKAKISLYGSSLESFRGLRSYRQSIFDTNPGSYVALDVHEGTNRFRRLFVAFAACITGFDHVRPMLFLDGSHLKSQFKGIILSAIGKDGNNGLFPLCFAFVDAEDVENWSWFLTHLKEILDPSRNITFITDRHVGLVDGIPRLFPNSFHSFCIYHLKLNIQEKCSRSRKNFKFFKKRMVRMLKLCAYAPTIELFNLNLAEMLKVGGDVAKDFLSTIPYENWATAHFEGMRYGEMASSAVESFNNWILEERNLPICQMLDAIRIKMMKLMSDRKSKAMLWKSAICPRIEKELGKSINVCRSWSIAKSSEHVYEVFSSPSCTVDLASFSCSCMGWQLFGIPCHHAVACILSSRQQLHEFVDAGYLSTSYASSYEVGLYPISTIYQAGSTSRTSNSSDVLPPSSKRAPGRPKKIRIASKGEFKRIMTCGRCHVPGRHNKRTCKAAVLFH